MDNKHLLLFLQLTLSTFLNALGQNTCNYQVEGTVYDRSSNEPLGFATIQIKDSNKGAVADENGHFIIENICEEEFDLVFKFIGYKTVSHHHDVYHQLPKIYMASDEVTLKSVVVEGEKARGGFLSGTVSTLDGKEIVENRSRSLADLASKISGVSVLKTGQNIGKPIIHGLHSNRVLIINNGVRHEFQNWGTEHGPEIDASLIDNLQVIKGAATVRYGPDALGGVILIDPPAMELHENFNGVINIGAQTNGRVGEATLQLHKGFDRSAFMLQVSGIQQGDLKAPDYYLTNTGKKEWSAAFGGRYHWQKFDLNFYYSHFDQELGILRSSVNGNLNDLKNAFETEPPPDTGPFGYDINRPEQQVAHDLFKINGRWNGNGQFVEVQYAFQINDRQEYDLRRGAAPSIDLQLLSHTLDLHWGHKPMGQWSGSIGFQGLYQDNNNIEGTNTVPFIPNYNAYRAGIYMIEANNLNETTVLELGLRYDYQFLSIIGRESDNNIYTNDLSYQNITGTVGITKDLNFGSFRSNLGTAWRPPNVSELYSYGRHQSVFEYGLWRFAFLESGGIDATGILTDSDKPVSSEMGIKWVNSLHVKHKKWDTEFTLFGNYVANYIFTRPYGITNTIRGAYPYFIYDQTNALFAGVDISSVYKHTSRFQSDVRASYLYAKDIDNDDYFVGLPPINLHYNATYNFGKIGQFKDNKISLGLAYNFKQFQAPRTITVQEILNAEQNNENIFEDDNSNFDFLDPSGGYWQAGFKARTSFSSFDFLFQIENMFNTAYRNYTDRLRYYADDTGINFILTATYNF